MNTTELNAELEEITRNQPQYAPFIIMHPLDGSRIPRREVVVALKSVSRLLMECMIKQKTLTFETVPYTWTVYTQSVLSVLAASLVEMLEVDEE